MNGVLVQFLCVIISSLLFAESSFPLVWPSYALKVLESDQSPLGFKITQTEGNLISSMPMLGSVISMLVAEYISEVLGRKKSQILSGLLFTVAWSLILTSRSLIQILIGRFVMGLSSGLANVVVIVYTIEITQLSVRASATAMASLLYNLGMTVSYLLGWFCSYDVICYISLTGTVLYVVLVSCLKETPPYLLRIGKEKEALSSLKFYRGQKKNTEAILKELLYLKIQANLKTDVIKDVEETDLMEKIKLGQENENIDTNTENSNSFKLLFTIPHNRRALINSIVFMVLAVFMGMMAVQTYASQIFAKATPALSSDMCAVLLSLVMVVTSVLGVAVTDLFRRRTLMISTCIISTICLLLLGAVMRWPWVPAWVGLLAVLVFCLAFQLGVINLVIVQLSESFGPQVNSAATTIVLGFMFLANFVVVFFFGLFVEYLGIDGTFFMFSGIAAVTSVLAIFWTKETRRVPLENVQKMYANGFLYKKVDDFGN